jgi:glycosidase
VLGVGYLLCNLGIPCVYYGTEQGFDGSGDKDTCIRECMFGGKWGAFDTTGVHFFNPEHPIYKRIGKISQIRASLPALRYGRQYFRDISGDGEHFGCPVDGKCTLVFSRILDTQEIVCLFNLDTQPRNDWVHVGKNQLGPGSRLVDALSESSQTFEVKDGPEGSAMVQVPLEPRQMRILKLTS